RAPKAGGDAHGTHRNKSPPRRWWWPFTTRSGTPGGGVTTRRFTRPQHEAVVRVLRPHLSGLALNPAGHNTAILDWAEWEAAFTAEDLPRLDEELIAYTVFDERGRPWTVQFRHTADEIAELDRLGLFDIDFPAALAAHEAEHAARPHATHPEHGWRQHRLEVAELVIHLERARTRRDGARAPSALFTEHDPAPLPGTEQPRPGDQAPGKKAGVAPNTAAGGQHVLDGMAREELRREAEKLTDDYREVLTLLFIDELPVKETAERMGRSAGAIRMLRDRAVTELRRLRAEGDSDPARAQSPRRGMKGDESRHRLGLVVKDAVADADRIHREHARGRLTAGEAEHAIRGLNDRIEALEGLPRHVVDAWVLYHGVGVPGLPLSLVARQLGIDRTNLRRQLERYGLTTRHQTGWSPTVAQTTRVPAISPDTALLAAALSSPPRTREQWWRLLYLQGRSLSEIAAAYGTTVRAVQDVVSSRDQRAERLLRDRVRDAVIAGYAHPRDARVEVGGAWRQGASPVQIARVQRLDLHLVHLVLAQLISENSFRDRYRQHDLLSRPLPTPRPAPPLSLRAVLDAVTAPGTHTLDELERTLSNTPKRIRNHLSALIRLGLVGIEGHGDSRRYRPTPGTPELVGRIDAHTLHPYRELRSTLAALDWLLNEPFDPSDGFGRDAVAQRLTKVDELIRDGADHGRGRHTLRRLLNAVATHPEIRIADLSMLLGWHHSAMRVRLEGLKNLGLINITRNGGELRYELAEGTRPLLADLDRRAEVTDAERRGRLDTLADLLDGDPTLRSRESLAQYRYALAQIGFPVRKRSGGGPDTFVTLGGL
ncbi:MAG: RNA polymerase sigma factor, partial [Pseudonocardia sp.]